MSELSEEMGAVSPQFFPREGTVLLPPGATDVLLCVANPLRWGLVLAVSAVAAGSAQPVNLSTQQGRSAATGYSIQAGGPLDLNYRSHPALVQSAWFANNPTGVNVQVEVFEELVQQ